MEVTIPAIDCKAVRRRLRLIRAALDLPPAEVDEGVVVVALDGGDEAKFAFADKYDWIIRGDVAPLPQIPGLSIDLHRTEAPFLAP